VPYTSDVSLALGSGKAGLTDLRAQLVDTAGVNVGAAVTTGFTEIGQGNYLWHYAVWPDGHRGGVKFYSAATPTTILAFVAVNPEDVQTTAGVADGLLNRNLAGGADGGRTVRDALRFLRNRWTRTATALVVYAEDDTTPAWTSVLTVSGGTYPVVESNPP
jgi:hypothetical protein